MPSTQLYARRMLKNECFQCKKRLQKKCFLATMSSRKNDNLYFLILFIKEFWQYLYFLFLYFITFYSYYYYYYSNIIYILLIYYSLSGMFGTKIIYTLLFLLLFLFLLFLFVKMLLNYKMALI